MQNTKVLCLLHARISNGVEWSPPRRTGVLPSWAVCSACCSTQSCTWSQAALMVWRCAMSSTDRATSFCSFSNSRPDDAACGFAASCLEGWEHMDAAVQRNSRSKIELRRSVQNVYGPLASSSSIGGCDIPWHRNDDDGCISIGTGGPKNIEFCIIPLQVETRSSFFFFVVMAVFFRWYDISQSCFLFFLLCTAFTTRALGASPMNCWAILANFLRNSNCFVAYAISAATPTWFLRNWTRTGSSISAPYLKIAASGGIPRSNPQAPTCINTKGRQNDKGTDFGTGQTVRRDRKDSIAWWYWSCDRRLFYRCRFLSQQTWNQGISRHDSALSGKWSFCWVLPESHSTADHSSFLSARSKWKEWNDRFVWMKSHQNREIQNFGTKSCISSGFVLYRKWVNYVGSPYTKECFRANIHDALVFFWFAEQGKIVVSSMHLNDGMTYSFLHKFHTGEQRYAEAGSDPSTGANQRSKQNFCTRVSASSIQRRTRRQSISSARGWILS